uniref:Uncharacterized protein n=1 Tax=Triticum urartu TaxID=4572 RepID=A0A8R7QRD3_TRIUA
MSRGFILPKDVVLAVPRRLQGLEEGDNGTAVSLADLRVDGGPAVDTLVVDRADGLAGRERHERVDVLLSDQLHLLPVLEDDHSPLVIGSSLRRLLGFRHRSLRFREIRLAEVHGLQAIYG